jgi:hypothetical protein
MICSVAGDGLTAKNKMIINNTAPFNSAEIEMSRKNGKQNIN